MSLKLHITVIKVSRYSFFKKLGAWQFNCFNFRILLFSEVDKEALIDFNIFSSRFVNFFVIILFCISIEMTMAVLCPEHGSLKKK